MKIAAVNVGLPREVVWHDRRVTTAIYKSPVEGRIPLRRLNLEGDRQADLSVHGGAFKAVYCYPHEHYGWWTRELARGALPIGMFGENLTTEGLVEASVHVGDQFSMGTAHVIVTQPRLPCYKLGIRFESDDMVRRFLASGRSGFYVAVEREGDIAAGDEIRLLARDPHGVSIGDIGRLYVKKAFDDADAALARSAMNLAALPDSWRKHFRERLTTA